MKKFIKNFLVICMMVFAFLTVTSTTNVNSAFADDSTCRYLIGMRSWNCDVGAWDSEDAIAGNIRQIIFNVGEAISTVASYLALGFVIYGGYKYMMSSGDPGKAMSGKKILTRAIIGLAICMLSKVIFNAMIAAMGNQQLTMDDSINLLKNLFNWFTSVAGIVAVIFIIVGGVGYMTSAGDPSKLQKAKKTILYAVIGLIIVALSAVIINFVMDIVSKNGGEVTSLTEQVVAIKE
ncbi:hypothetical protein IJS18_01430 [Candidatus Saccharibacteria bacterium]|nr:hypothetical protein [Candidatus Saccharibacteria bacterium]